LYKDEENDDTEEEWYDEVEVWEEIDL